MSDNLNLSREELLDRLGEVSDRIRDRLADFRFHVRHLLGQRDISDSEAAEVEAEVEELRELFDEAYESMQACDEVLAPDDADYRGLRASLIEDFRQLNIIEHDFQRNRERPEEERERIPELDEEEPEEVPEEEPEEEPDDEFIDEGEDEAVEKKARREKLAKQGRATEAASHQAARERADAEAQRRRDMEAQEHARAEQLRQEELARQERDRYAQETRAQEIRTHEQSSPRYEPVSHEQARMEEERRSRAEQDARLAREAEDKAHRDAQTRTPEDQSRPSSYEYEGPKYGPQYEPHEQERRHKYSQEIHQELVDKYRERAEHIEYDGESQRAPQQQVPGFVPGWAPQEPPTQDVIRFTREDAERLYQHMQEQRTDVQRPSEPFQPNTHGQERIPEPPESFRPAVQRPAEQPRPDLFSNGYEYKPETPRPSEPFRPAPENFQQGQEAARPVISPPVHEPISPASGEKLHATDPGRAEQDARLAQEAEDRAHKAYQQTPEVPKGYEPPRPAHQQDAPRGQTLQEQHAATVERYKVTDAEYRPAQDGFRMPPPPYRGPAFDLPHVNEHIPSAPSQTTHVQSEQFPVYGEDPRLTELGRASEAAKTVQAAATVAAPTFSVQDLSSAKERLSERMDAIERPSVQSWKTPAENSSELPPVYKPRDMVQERFGESLMREARQHVAGREVPDLSRTEVASSGGSTFSVYFDKPPTYVPDLPSPKDGVYRPTLGAYIPTVVRAGEQGPVSGSSAGAGNRPTVQAAFGAEVASKHGTEETVYTPLSSWASSTATLKFSTLGDSPKQARGGVGVQLFPERRSHTQIYGLVSADGKQVYIDRVEHGHLAEAMQSHAKGQNPLTAHMFQGKESDNSSPAMFLLADYQGRDSDVAQPIQAFAKRFQDNGMRVTVAGGAVGKMTLSNMSKGGVSVYDSISHMPAQELLTNSAALHIEGKGGRKTSDNFVIQKAMGLTAEEIGILNRKDWSDKTGKDTEKSSVKGKAVTRDTVTDPRASSIKNAIDKFRPESLGITRQMTASVRQALETILTEGDETDNPFIELDRETHLAGKIVHVAKATALPVTVPATALADAGGKALMEKALYGQLSKLDARGFNAVYNQTSADVSKLTEAIKGASGENLVLLKAQLRQAKASLAKMDNFKALKSRNAMSVEVKKAMHDSRGLLRHNLHHFDKTIGASAKSIRDSLATGNEFASLRAVYGKDLLSVSDQKLVVAMAQLRVSGRELRGQIKAIKLKIQTADASELSGLTAELNRLKAASKANATNYNLHKKLMEKRGQLSDLTDVASTVRGRIMHTRVVAKTGMMLSIGMVGGYILKSTARSNDYGLQGVNLIHNNVMAMRMGSRFIGHTTGLSSITANLRRRATNAMSDAIYRFTAPVRQTVERVVVAPVKSVATSAVSAATHGASVIAGHAATAISNATPAGVKTAATTTKAGIAAVKKGAKKAVDKIAGSAAGKAVSAVAHTAGKVFAGIGRVFHAIGAIVGAVGGFLMMILGWVMLLLVIIVLILGIFDSGSETDDGKIDLSTYDTYINESWAEYQVRLQHEINPASYGCESVEWDIPDLPSNKLVILTMMKVRLEHQTALDDLEEAEQSFLEGLWDTVSEFFTPDVRLGDMMDYLDYIVGALNPYMTNIDERQRQVWVSDGEGGGHYETETYYVLQVAINPYFFMGEGVDLHLINADGETSMDSIDTFGPITGSSWTSWDEDSREICDLIYHMDWGDLYTGLTGITVSTGDLGSLTEDAEKVLENLPDDLSPERQAVVEYAMSLVGKVNYFWGGKSLTLGWDSRWGTTQKVTAAGSSTTGTYRPFGMDCSGYVDWVFYNASGGSYVIGHGGGAHAQHTYCTPISWSEAIPGDLVFYPEDSHVGIVVGWDDSGQILIAHCSYGYNNVVITHQEGFTTIGRPTYY